MLKELEQQPVELNDLKTFTEGLLYFVEVSDVAR